jgi:hypothetical protein
MDIAWTKVGNLDSECRDIAAVFHSMDISKEESQRFVRELRVLLKMYSARTHWHPEARTRIMRSTPSCCAVRSRYAASCSIQSASAVAFTPKSNLHANRIACSLFDFFGCSGEMNFWVFGMKFVVFSWNVWLCCARFF